MAAQIPPDFWRSCADLIARGDKEGFARYVGGLDPQLQTYISCEKAIDYVIPRTIARVILGAPQQILHAAVCLMKQIVDSKDIGDCSPLLKSVAVVNYTKAIALRTGEKRRVLDMILQFLISRAFMPRDVLARQQPIIQPLVYLVTALQFPQSQDNERRTTLNTHMASYDRRFFQLTTTLTALNGSLWAKDLTIASHQLAKLEEFGVKQGTLLDLLKKTIIVYKLICSTLSSGRLTNELDGAIKAAILAYQNVEIEEYNNNNNNEEEEEKEKTSSQENQAYHEFINREKSLFYNNTKEILESLISLFNALELLMGKRATKYTLESQTIENQELAEQQEQGQIVQNVIENMMNGLVGISGDGMTLSGMDPYSLTPGAADGTSVFPQLEENITTQYSRIIIDLFILLHRTTVTCSNPHLTLFAQHLVTALGASSICPIIPLGYGSELFCRARTGMALAAKVNVAKTRDPSTSISTMTTYKTISLLRSVEETPGLEAAPESLNSVLLALSGNTTVITNHKAYPSMGLSPLNIFYAAVASYRLGQYEQAALGFAKARSLGHRLTGVLCTDGQERGLDTACLEWQALACLRSGHVRECAVCMELLAEEDATAHARLASALGSFIGLATRLSALVQLVQ